MIYSDIAIVGVIFAVFFDLYGVKTALLSKSVFWTSYAIIVPFQLITNWWLTSRGIVTYSPDAIIGTRIAGAPIEDLLFGFALVQFGYFIAISRMNISMALIIEFTAPIWIVLWIKYVRKSFVPKDMWIAISLAFIGMLLLAQVWKGMTLDPLGLFSAFLTAFALATYFILGERLGHSRPTASLNVLGFGIASAIWAIAFPLWSFPTEIFTQSINLGGPLENYNAPGWTLILWVVLLGTVLPYLCVLAGIKILSASTSSVIGMLEPVLAGIFAWIWINETWNALQLIGGATVIAGIYIADKTRSKVS
mgnify:CR=1 FL=1